MTTLSMTAADGQHVRRSPDVLRQMVDAAVWAPSAENTQPWRFSIKGGSLIIAMSAAHRLPSDVTGMLAFTSIGAAVENAVLASREQRLEPQVEFLAGDEPPPISADFRPLVALTPRGVATPDDLFALVRRRRTTRRMERDAIEPATLNRIDKRIGSFPNAHVDWITDAATVREIGQLVGLGNRIRFEHEEFHHEFYDNLRLSHDEAAATRDGLDIDALQLSFAAKKALASLRRWPVMRFANRLGFSRTVAKQAAAEVRSSGAVGILSISAPSLPRVIDGGRALERLWLATTAEGLGLHPTASLPAFLAYGKHSDAQQLPPKLTRRVASLADRFGSLLPELAGRTVQMAFRIGRALPPPVRSLRKETDSMFYA